MANRTSSFHVVLHPSFTLLFAVLFAVGCSCEPSLGATDEGSDDEDVLDAALDDGATDALVPQLNDSAMVSVDSGVVCGNLLAVVRDFDVSHIDFEDDNPGHVAGLVMDMLDAEDKPVYAHGMTKMGGIENLDSFAQWYRDVPGTNQRFEIMLSLTEMGSSYVYDNAFFFPVDGMGFGNSGTDDNEVMRNFHFTTEIHTAFEYQGGEVFTFRGDDDLWLFINGQLEIDIGGVHSAIERTLDLDTLGLTVGEMVNLDIFHAERHTHASNFRIETTIECFVSQVE